MFFFFVSSVFFVFVRCFFSLFGVWCFLCVCVLVVIYLLIHTCFLVALACFISFVFGFGEPKGFRKK